jgi:glycosyltransferase involved in cell wall biosynthesis
MDETQNYSLRYQIRILKKEGNEGRIMVNIPNQIKIGVVVATQDRPELLSKRSIPSILGQSHPPDFLIVVDDSRLDENCRLNEHYIKSIGTDNTNVAIIRNHRTPGACGSWNTGIDWMKYPSFLSEQRVWFNLSHYHTKSRRGIL